MSNFISYVLAFYFNFKFWCFLKPVPILSMVNIHFIHVKMNKLFLGFTKCFIMPFNIHGNLYLSKTMIILSIFKMRHLWLKGKDTHYFRK